MRQRTTAAIALTVSALGAACGGGSEAAPVASSVTSPEEPATVTVALRFVEGPEGDEAATPTTRVLLVDIDEARGRRTTDLGTYRGVCSHLAARPGAVLSAQCFWAGAGARVEVSRDGDVMIAKRILLDEAQNDGEVREVGRIDLPPAAELELIAPTTRLGRAPAPVAPTSSE